MRIKRLGSLLLMAGLVSAFLAAVAIAAFVFSHHHTRKASAQTAAIEFDRLREQFRGQRPLLEMRDRRPREGNPSAKKSASLHRFHTVIFDTRGDEPRFVSITVPYNFGRLFGRGAGFRWLGSLTFLDDTEFDPEPIQLTLDQVEQHGPGLLVDYRHPGGGQFLAWVE